MRKRKKTVGKKNILVMDTNIYFNHFFLKLRSFSLLKNSLENLNIEWILPEIVMDEVSGKYKEKLTDLKNNIEKINKEIDNLIGEEKQIKFDINQDLMANNYKNSLQELFQSHENMKTVPYPSTTHKEIANRAILKLKPFKENGKGYRDCLIWETIKSLLKENPDSNLIFVTANRSDFFDKNDNLSAVLIEDLEKHSISKDRIQVFNSLFSLESEFVLPQLKSLESIKNSLLSDKWELKKEIIISEIEEELYLKSVDISLPYSNCSEALINYINDVSIDDIESVSKLSETEIIISLTSKINADFEYYVDHINIYSYDYENDPPPFEILEFDWNEYVAQVYITHEIYMQFIILYNTCTKLMEITDYQILQNE